MFQNNNWFEFGFTSASSRENCNNYIYIDMCVYLLLLAADPDFLGDDLILVLGELPLV